MNSFSGQFLTSSFLAQAIGLYLFLINVAMLMYQNRFKKIATELFTDMTLITFTGAIRLALGLVIVLQHHQWVPDWQGLVTLVGWVLLLQGFTRVFAPEAFIKMSRDMQGKSLYMVGCWVRLLAGVFLIWKGFAENIPS